MKQLSVARYNWCSVIMNTWRYVECHSMSDTINGMKNCIIWPVCRYLWSVSSILFVSLALWQAVTLTLEYLEYESVTVIEERDLQIGHSKGDIPPPSFTFCNLNAFSGNASYIMAMNNLLSPANFSKFVKEVTTCDNCTIDDSRMMDNIQHELLTPHGYLAFIGEENATKLGNRREDFIVGCFLRKRDAFRSYRDYCTSRPFSRIVDTDYYNCWTLDLPEFEYGSLTGITVILHLDNFFTEHYENFHISYDEHGNEYLTCAPPPP